MSLFSWASPSCSECLMLLSRHLVTSEATLEDEMVLNVPSHAIIVLQSSSLPTQGLRSPSKPSVVASLISEYYSLLKYHQVFIQSLAMGTVSISADLASGRVSIDPLQIIHSRLERSKDECLYMSQPRYSANTQNGGSRG